MPALRPADLEMLSAYLDNELTPDERALLEQRLASDETLRQELAALRQVSLAVRGMPMLRAPRDFRLDPAVYGRRPQRQWFRLYQWSSALSAAAALVVFALGVFGVLSRNSGVTTNLAAYQAADAVTVTDEMREIAILPTMASLPVTQMPPIMGRSADAAMAQEAAPVPPMAGLEMQDATLQPGEPIGIGGGGAEDTGERVTAEPAEIAAAVATANALEMAPMAEVEGAVEEGAPIGMGGGGLQPTNVPSETSNAAPEMAAVPPAVGADDGEAAALDGLRDGALDEGPREDDSWKAVSGIVIPATATPAPAAEFFAQEQETPAEPAVIVGPVDPGILIGASVVLLAFAAMLFAFSRRLRR